MTLLVDVRHRLGSFAVDVSFRSESGVTALFGRSGSGKTSVMRIIAGLDRPDDGRIELDGDVLVDTKKHILVPKHRRRFGYVFQEARLFPHLSVRQNLNYGRWFAPKAERRESFDRILDLLGIEHLLERRPAKLSGGEKQRVAIGRALLSSPRMLLMVEPLAALDDARKAEILPYLERLRDDADIPIIYVSHSVAEVARLASRIVLMNNGRVEAVGEAGQILSHPSIAVAVDRRETGALLEGRLHAYDSDQRLASIMLKSAQLVVPLAEELPAGRPVRLHIPARDVMLATARPKHISALNIVPGTVVTLMSGTDGMCDVEVDCGGDTIQARLTEVSVRRLDILPGKHVFAVIKTVALRL